MRNQTQGGQWKTKGIEQSGTAESATPIARRHADAAAQYAGDGMRGAIEPDRLRVVENEIALETDAEWENAIVPVMSRDRGVEFAPNHHGSAPPGCQYAEVGFRLAKEVFITPVEALSFGDGVGTGQEIHGGGDQTDPGIDEGTG